MTYYSGKDSYVGIKKQAVAGTAETTATIFVPVEDFPDIKSKSGNEYAKEFRSTYAEINNVYRKSLSSEGSIKFPGYPDMLSYALYGVFGAVSSSGVSDSAYTHTYSTAKTLPIWTVFLGTDVLAVEKYHDMTMKSLKLSLKPESRLDVEVPLLGASGDIITAALTPSYGTQRGLHHADATVSLGGSPNCNVESLDLTIDRGVKDTRTMCGTGLSAFEPNMVYPTTMSVEGNMTVFFNGYSEVEYWFGKTGSTAFKTGDYATSDAKRALILAIEGALIGVTSKDKLTLTMNNVLYDDVKIDRTYDDRVKASFDFKCQFDGAQVITAEMISKVVDPDA